MVTHALLVALAVFLCFGGNYLTGQSMLERPLVVGLVTGLLMGDMRQGILMGASLEAIFLGNVNIGGVISAEPVTATVISTTFAITAGVSKGAALTLAIPIGMLAAFMVMFLKNVLFNIFAPVLDRIAAEGNEHKINALQWGTWAFYYLIIASVTFVGILAGSKPVNAFVNNIPQVVMNGLNAAGGLLPAVGFAMLMKLLWDNKLAVYYLLGFVLTAYLKLPAVAVAVIGVVICVVVAQNEMRLNKMESEPRAAAATSNNNGSSEDQAKQEEEDFFS